MNRIDIKWVAPLKHFGKQVMVDDTHDRFLALSAIKWTQRAPLAKTADPRIGVELVNDIFLSETYGAERFFNLTFERLWLRGLSQSR
jgi:hypothetical protein